MTDAAKISETARDLRLHNSEPGFYHAIASQLVGAQATIATQAAQIEALRKALNMANVYTYEDADNLVLMVGGVEIVDTTDEKMKSALLIYDATKSAALAAVGEK